MQIPHHDLNRFGVEGKVEQDPYQINQQGYLTAQKKTLDRQNLIYQKHISNNTIPDDTKRLQDAY